MLPDQLLRCRPSCTGTATRSSANQIAICAGAKIIVLVFGHLFVADPDSTIEQRFSEMGL